MKRGAIDTIGKLYTLSNTRSSINLLDFYVSKITNNKCVNLKFINTYDAISMDLLFLALKVMHISSFTTNDYKKINKDELNYYMKIEHGIKYFTNQYRHIKNEEQLIKFIIEALKEGDYTCNINNTVKIRNIIVNSDWLTSFVNFIIDSLNMNKYLSDDSHRFTYKTIEFPDSKDIKDILKNTKIYEYNIVNKNRSRLSYNDTSIIYNTFKDMYNYDFNNLKDINSKIAKDNYILSINKININLKGKDRKIIDNMYNESGTITDEIKDYIKEVYEISSLEKYKNIHYQTEAYEILRSLSHAYKNNYTLKECRKLFDVEYLKKYSKFYLSIARFYINYIYDEKTLKEKLFYENLDLSEIRPKVINYDTPEYKSIINRLSNLNKKIVVENRRINKLISSKTTTKIDGISIELENLVEEVSRLRNELDIIKDQNHQKNNINRVKISYLKEAIFSGSYKNNNGNMFFDFYDPTNHKNVFHLVIYNELLDMILNNKNNLQERTSIYEKASI